MYKITSVFNATEHFRKGKSHNGIDFSMENGTPLKAIQEGTIKVADFGNVNAGKTVYIYGKDGKTYIYGHLSEFKVKTGDYVHQGDIIGLSGNSGHVVGANGGYHLHFAVKENGQFIDPAPYINFIQNMNNQNPNFNPTYNYLFDSYSPFSHNTNIYNNINITVDDFFNTTMQRFVEGLLELKMFFISLLHATHRGLPVFDTVLSLLC